MPKLNKLLSNLPFNPSLIGQISFYSQRLKKETAVRRMGFVMLALAVLVQLFAAMSPPQPSLARSPNDLINGGITEQSQAVLYCVNSQLDYGTILAHYGINCTDLDYGHSSVVTINSNDYNGQLFSMGRLPYGKAGEQPVNVPGTNGGSPLYIRYLWSWGNVNYRALSLYMHGQQFFILFDCGNLVSVGVPTTPPPPPAPTPPPPPPPAPPADKPSIGYLDVVNCTKIAGWAFDQDQPTTSIHVHIYVDGRSIADLVANQVRTDVGAAFPGAGNNHGYTMATPDLLKNTNTHTVNAYAIGIDASGRTNGANPLIGTKTVNLGTCTTPPPPSGNAACSSLKADSLGDRKYNFTATTVGDDYVVNSYKFDFGDKATKTVTSGLFLAKAEHTYAQAGNYTAKVTISVRVATGTNTSTAKTLTCSVTVNIKTVDTKPCEEAQSSENLEACLTPHKQAKNVTHGGSDANNTTASAGDVIEYTLSVNNVGKVKVPKYVFRESISDVLDYADITDFHGGSVDKYNIVTWPAVDVKPGQTVTRSLTVKIKDPIPGTPVSSSDPGHFDCKITNVFGDTITINMPGSTVCVAETANGKLVNTGPGTGVITMVGLTVIVGYFFARSRLLGQEVELVRKEYAASGGA